MKHYWFVEVGKQLGFLEAHGYQIYLAEDGQGYVLSSKGYPSVPCDSIGLAYEVLNQVTSRIQCKIRNPMERFRIFN